KLEDAFRPCDWFGHCNPCDIKIKTNRRQVYGWTSVEIKDIQGSVKKKPQKETTESTEENYN
ncbi:MAG: hypothetical protein KKG21_02450, partial [Candidatus Omnitrophica bacterium]|nr:hypothetical protein [Candidatus Omnitrophota bacterium]